MVIKKILRAFDNAARKMERICRKIGSEEDLLRLLRRNSSLNVNMLHFDNGEHSLLHLATLNNFPGCVDALLKHGANVGSRVKSSGNTSLHIAAWKGYIDIVRTICSHEQAHVDELSEDQFTALSLACWAGHVDVCQYLLSIGASPNIRNKHGYSPLILAARCGNYEVIDHLIKCAVCDVNETDNDGCSALHHACFEGRKDIIRLLLKHGAVITLKDKIGRSAKDFCKTRDISDLLGSVRNDSGSNRARTTFKLRLKETTSESLTPRTAKSIKRTIPQSSGTLSKQYLASLGNANPFDSRKQHAGDIAGSLIFTTPINTKLIHNDSRDHLDGNGNEAVGLYIAPKVARELWRLCSSNGDYRALKRLLTAHPTLTEGKPSALSHLRDVSNWTLLMHASDKGFIDIVKILVSVDPGSIYLSCPHGLTPLYLSALRGQENVVRLLLSVLCSQEDSPQMQIVSVDRTNNIGRTALHAAAEYGFTGIARLLVYRGADENMQDKDGLAPLHLACRHSHDELVIFLLTECCANPLVITLGGEIPEDMTDSIRIKRLLRAIILHRQKSKTDSVEYSHESAQAWLAVEIAIKDLRNQPQSEEKPISTPAETLHAESPTFHSTQIETMRGAQAQNTSTRGSDFKRAAWNLITKTKVSSNEGTRSEGLGGNVKSSENSLKQLSRDPAKTLVDIFEKVQNDTKRVSTKSSIDDSATNMSIRARLKQKYRLAQDRSNDSSQYSLPSNHDSVEGDYASVMLGDETFQNSSKSSESFEDINRDKEMEFSDKLKLQSADFSSLQPTNSHDSLNNLDSSVEFRDTKELKGSLLLTLILSQVYNVYSNKISRAFYRWKHRSFAGGERSNSSFSRGSEIGHFLQKSQT